VPEHTGILNVNKPTGWTSHDVVARVRRLAGQRRVGHAGTLDPLADGVLAVLLGRATLLADIVQAGAKEYRARVTLGSATTTDDAEGEVVETAPLPDFSDSDLDEALTRFKGEIQQVPPAFSAIKVDGRRAYSVARKGGAVSLEARSVTVYALHLVERSDRDLVLDVTCSKGTYVRALARDLAHSLGTVGHLSALTRTRVGPFDLGDALTLEQVAEQGVAAVLLPPDAALPDAPEYCATAEEARLLHNGRAVEVPGFAANLVRVYGPASHSLQWVGQADGRVLRPRLTLALPANAPLA
jgi:tRNA pseudouridine55 synthase